MTVFVVLGKEASEEEDIEDETSRERMKMKMKSMKENKTDNNF